MIKTIIAAGICYKEYIIVGLYHSYRCTWVIFFCFSPWKLGFAIFNKNRTKIICIFYTGCKKIFSHKSLCRSINSSIFLYCHDWITGHVITIDNPVFDAHAKGGWFSCTIVESTAVYSDNASIWGYCIRSCLSGSAISSVGEGGFQLFGIGCLYMRYPVGNSMDWFAFKFNIKSAAFVFVSIAALSNCWFSICRFSIWRFYTLPFAVYIIFTYPGIFCHHSCFLAEIVIIFSYLLPALCHGGIAEEIVFFSILSKPLPGNCHAGFIEIIGIFITCCPAIAEHGTIFAIVIVFITGTLHPPGETFAVGNTVVIITFILKRTADQTPLWIIKIVISVYRLHFEKHYIYRREG